MRKKYLSALLFGALLVTSAGTFTSCKDYDDEINNLQEQVDRLANLPTTETMTAAIEEAMKGIQTQVDDLKGQLEGLDDSEAIAKLEQRVKALEDKLAGYDELLKKIEKLEGINHDQYLTAEDIEDFVGQDAINDAVNALYRNENGTYKGAIVDYITSVLAAQTVAKTDFETLETAWNNFIAGCENVTTLKSIVERLEALETYSEAITDMVGEGKDYADFAALLAQIETNKQNIANLAIPGDADIVNTIKAELKKEDGIFKGIQDELSKLGVDVDSLKSMVKSVVFIPSYTDGKVVFSNIQFRKTLTGPYETKYMDNTQEVKFRVSPASAVSKLAENYEIKLYDDEEVKTRSSVTEGTNYSIVSGEDGSKFTDLGNGLISIKLEAKQANSVKRAIALALEPKKKENVDNEYDNITSDYIIAETNVVEIEDVIYDFNSIEHSTYNVDKTIYYNGKTDEDTKADYSNGTWYVKLNNISGYIEMSKYSLLKPEDFTLTYSLAGTNADLFENNNGVVSLKQPNISDVDKNVDVKSKVALSGWYLKSQASTRELGTVTVAAKAIEIAAADQVKDYNGTNTQTVLTVDMRTLLAANGFDGAFIDNIITNPTTETKIGVYGSNTEAQVTVDMNSDDLKVTLPVKAKSGNYNIVVSFESSTNQTKVNVTIPLTIKDAVLPYKLSESKIPERWQGDVVTLNPRATGSSLVYDGFSFDSMFSWGTYNDFDGYKAAIEALGGSVTISTLTHEGTNVVGYNGISFDATDNTLDINPATYRTDVKTSLIITATYGGATETVKMVVGVVNVSGSWKITTTGTAAQKTNFDLIFRNDGVSDEAIITNIEWKDALGESMWKNNAFEGSYSTSNPAGFGVKYKVVSSDITMVQRYINNITGNANTGYYVTLDTNRKLEFKSASDVSFTEFTFQIVVEPYAPFGPIEGYDKAANTLTIKLRP